MVPVKVVFGESLDHWTAMHVVIEPDIQRYHIIPGFTHRESRLMESFRECSIAHGWIVSAGLTRNITERVYPYMTNRDMRFVHQTEYEVYHHTSVEQFFDIIGWNQELSVVLRRRLCNYHKGIDLGTRKKDRPRIKLTANLPVIRNQS